MISHCLSDITVYLSCSLMLLTSNYGYLIYLIKLKIYTESLIQLGWLKGDLYNRINHYNESDSDIFFAAFVLCLAVNLKLHIHV